MTPRRLPLALLLAALVLGGIATAVLTRPDPAPEVTADDYQCTTCDARAASKKRSREALQALSSEGE